ncbi:MAG: PAQR family membrane homeostasis protein TrhA [Jatrophihabitans sp.]
MSALDQVTETGPLPIPLTVKPRLRGWLHAYAAVLSVASGATLIAVATALRGHRAGVSTAVYAVTVTALFSTSALYHRIPWQARGHAVMKRLDHSMIFVFIAGTYTPIAVLTLPRASAVVVLVVVWTGALFGVALQSAWPDAPRWLSVPCYVGLGWVAVFVMPQLLHAGITPLVLVIVGGLLYTVGAIVYGLKRPNPSPAVFGFHEVFHLCTLLAAVCHYIAIWFAVFTVS